MYFDTFAYNADSGKTDWLRAPGLAMLSVGAMMVTSGKGLGSFALGAIFSFVLAGMSAHRGEAMRNDAYSYDTLPRNGQMKLDTINNTMFAANLLTIAMICALSYIVLQQPTRWFGVVLAVLMMVDFSFVMMCRNRAHKDIAVFERMWERSIPQRS
jgi:hypothetical protein